MWVWAGWFVGSDAGIYNGPRMHEESSCQTHAQR